MFCFANSGSNPKLKILDLTVVSTRFASLEIEKAIGSYSSNSRIEVCSFNKLVFTDENDGGSTYKVQLDCHPKGLCLYFRNFTSNRLVIIPEHEIVAITLIKDADLVKPARISLFKTLVSLGISTNTASKYLMPVEVSKESPAYLTVTTEDTELRLGVATHRAEKLCNLLKQSSLGGIMEFSVKPLKII